MIVCICRGISEKDLKDATKVKAIHDLLLDKSQNMFCGLCTFDIKTILNQYDIEQNKDNS